MTGGREVVKRAELVRLKTADVELMVLKERILPTVDDALRILEDLDLAAGRKRWPRAAAVNRLRKALRNFTEVEDEPVEPDRRDARILAFPGLGRQGDDH